jgi:ABC-type sulfate/molybdate transport systems ATPase subunit
MLDFFVKARRGHFVLSVAASLASEWTVIFGPSGSGKTTLLRILAGLEKPDEGHIAFDRETLTDTASHTHVKPGRRHIAVVAQQPALFPHLTVSANVAYGLAGMDAQSRAARTNEMLELVDAKDLAHRMPRDLSGGEAQRIALARSLAPLRRLLLLDEPFSALDGTTSDSLLARLQLWTREHRVQTLLITHDATDAFAAEAEVVLLNDGKLVALGSAATALASERERIFTRLHKGD